MVLPIILIALQAAAQTPSPVQLQHPQGQTAAPPVITLQDALNRAANLDAQYLAARSNAALAVQDRLQSKAALLPGFTQSTQDHITQGNGTIPTGRFVSNDGIHMYRVWAVGHQDVTADTFQRTTYRRAQAAEALADARAEIARRGLTVTVTTDYYNLVTTQRRYATAQQALQQAQRFLDITQQQENAGQVAHADVVKAQVQYEQQNTAFQQAMLEMETARLTLAVLLFPDLNENFTVIDDLDSALVLPPFPEIESLAAKQNPDVRAAEEAVRQANFDVQSARNAYLPALAIDGIYGIEANAIASKAVVSAIPEAGPVPTLGFYLIGNLTVPVFDWGIRRSKVRQAQIREEQAQIERTQAQRQVLANLYAFYNEALTARAAVDSARRTSDLAAESLRLVNLRYQAGESTALEVVDAQRTAVDARNAYDAAQGRYRVSIANLQTVTGAF